MYCYKGIHTLLFLIRLKVAIKDAWKKVILSQQGGTKRKPRNHLTFHQEGHKTLFRPMHPWALMHHAAPWLTSLLKAQSQQGTTALWCPLGQGQYSPQPVNSPPQPVSFCYANYWCSDWLQRSFSLSAVSWTQLLLHLFSAPNPVTPHTTDSKVCSNFTPHSGFSSCANIFSLFMHFIFLD